ncbi:MAG: hypothetical protein GY752_07085 [bacterium]|nr:hypothetical protein [bacterium]MCP4800299.1 hypothetical protein [bacterium]
MKRLAAFIVAFLFVLLWSMEHPAIEQTAGADIFEHLSVADHLLAGDGFVNDITYPVSYAFPFAQKLPQPMLHRAPGFPLLLTVPVALSDNPISAVRIMQLLTLGLIVGCGSWFLLTKQQPALVPWLILLFFSPLVDISVSFGQSELVCAFILLVIWMLRDKSVLLIAVLTGLLGLIRLELCLLPLLWIILQNKRSATKLLLAAFGIWIAIQLPWWIRNFLVTGNPWFALQSYAEHLKMTPLYPDYSIYTKLEPQTLWQSIQSHPGILWDKFNSGIVFQLRRLDTWIPWPLWIAFFAIGKRKAVQLGASLLLLIIGYAVFSHTVRYMLVLLPIVSVELWMGLSKRTPDKSASVVGMILLAVALQFASPAFLPNWDRNYSEDSELIIDTKDGIVFTNSAKYLWETKQSGIWSPANKDVENKIIKILQKNSTPVNK